MRLAWISIIAACGGATPISEPRAPHAAPTTTIEGKRAEPIDPIAALASPPEARSWIVPGLAQLELGAPTVQAPPGGTELEVTLLEEQATMVRVAVRLDHVAFALWTERARLLAIAARDQLVSSHPGGDFVEFGTDPIAAQLHAGARVRVLAHKDKWAQIRYLGELELDGWVPDDALELRSPRDSRYRGRIPTGRTSLMVLPGSVIRTEPQWVGRELALVNNGFTLDTIKNIDQAWAEVGYEDGDVRVHGYVSRHDPPGRIHRPAQADTPPTTVTPNATIPPGTCLYAAERGEAIGFVVAPAPGEFTPSVHPGWYAVSFDTPWGPLAFAVQGPTDQELVTCQPTAPPSP